MARLTTWSHPFPAPVPGSAPARPGALSAAVCGLVGPLAMALALAACGGGGGRRGASDSPGNPSGNPPAIPLGPASGPSSSGPPTAPSPSPRPVPAAGSVAFTAVGVPLSEPGLRVLVRPSGGAIRVVARGVSGGSGGSDGVRVCPINGVSGVPPTDGCVAAGDGQVVDLVVDPGAGGVLLRPPEASIGAGIRVDEITLIYVPEGDQITVVTPALAPPEVPGDCPGGRCAMAFELAPTGPGTFVLEADGRGARPRLTLEAGAAGGPSRVVSAVEGGGRLAIRSSVDGRSDASLVLRNLGDADLPPLEISLVWPGRR